MCPLNPHLCLSICPSRPANCSPGGAQFRRSIHDIMPYIYTYIYIHTYIHACMHTCIHTYIHTYRYTYTHVHIYTYTYIYIYTCIYIYMCIYIFTSSMHVNVHVYLVCIYIYIVYPYHWWSFAGLLLLPHHRRICYQRYQWSINWWWTGRVSVQTKSSFQCRKMVGHMI